MVKKDNVLVEFRTLIQETIALIKRYISSFSDDIPPLILRNIITLYQNDDYRKLLVLKNDIGQSLFANLQLYIRARHTYIESLIAQALVSGKKPIFSSKLILDCALKGFFPITQQVQIRGLTLLGLRKSLISLIHQQKIESKSRAIRKRKLPDTIQYMLWKKRALEKVKRNIINEVKASGGDCPVRYLIPGVNKPMSRDTAIYRTIALIQLIRNNALILTRKNNEFHVKLSKYE